MNHISNRCAEVGKMGEAPFFTGDFLLIKRDQGSSVEPEGDRSVWAGVSAG
jgi:hypothetical protein